MASTDNPLDTLRLSQRDRDRLVEKINSQRQPVPSDRDRRQLRVDFSHVEVEITIWHTDGRNITYKVLPRNLSTQGMAFVHGQFLHPGSACEVRLPTHNGKRAVKGRLLECRHQTGLVHEVSIKFDQPIELGDFVEFTPEQALREHREKREGGELGQALVVDALEIDLRLFTHWLGKFGFGIDKAYDTSEALSLLDRSPKIDVIMFDAQSASEEDLTLVTTARTQHHLTSYIIATSAEDDPQIETRVTEAGCDAFLPKPFQETELRDLIVGAMLGGQSNRGPMYSTMADDIEMRPLIKEFVENLEDFAVQLDHAMRTEDLTFAHQLCRQLKGAGGSYGFDSITLSALMATSLFQDSNPKVDAIRRSVDELIAVIRSARC